MSTLESKILDGKAAGYCSSSDGEDEGDFGAGFQPVDEDEHQANFMQKLGPSEQTGAKGVLKDHAEYLGEKAKQRGQEERRVIAAARKGMLSGEKEEEDFDEEDELEMLRAARIAEMKREAAGKVIELKTKEELLHTIENTNSGLLVVLLYETGDDLCNRVSLLCKRLAGEFSGCRASRITASAAGMTKKFIGQGIPALQIYESGQLVCNLVQLRTLIGEDPTFAALKALLQRYRISLRRNRKLFDDESDSD